MARPAKARSSATARLDADSRLLRRVARMLSKAEDQVHSGHELHNAERAALEAAARQMSTHGRDT